VLLSCRCGSRTGFAGRHRLRLSSGVVQHWTFDDVHVLYIDEDDDCGGDYPALANGDLHGPGWE
jgi:hypothetical protein